MKIFTKTNETGRIPATVAQKLNEFLLTNLDRFIVITIEARKKLRSNSQNAYYWGVVIDRLFNGLKELGYSKDEIHEILKVKFNGVKEVNIGGETILIPRTTTKMNTKEFMEYIEAIQRWAAKLNIDIPSPNEINYMIMDKAA
jgi:hypothetical protein